jgi:hypothetical protein
LDGLFVNQMGVFAKWGSVGMVVSVLGYIPMLGWLFGLFVHQMSFPKNEPFFSPDNFFPQK